MKAGEKLIFSPTRSQPRLTRTMFGAFTLLAWSLYLYLWAPLATLGLWLAGIRTSFLQLYIQQNDVNVGLLVQLFLIAVCCGTLLIGWAEYNRARFQGHDRRERLADVTIDQVAVALRAMPAHAAILQSARIATIAMNEQAIATGVRASAPLLPAGGARPAPIALGLRLSVPA
jgi:biofilm PGA synthesis protein PgaD